MALLRHFLLSMVQAQEVTDLRDTSSGATKIQRLLVTPAIHFATSMATVVNQALLAMILKHNQYPISQAAATGLGKQLQQLARGNAIWMVSTPFITR